MSGLLCHFVAHAVPELAAAAGERTGLLTYSAATAATAACRELLVAVFSCEAEWHRPPALSGFHLANSNRRLTPDICLMCFCYVDSWLRKCHSGPDERGEGGLGGWFGEWLKGGGGRGSPPGVGVGGRGGWVDCKAESPQPLAFFCSKPPW